MTIRFTVYTFLLIPLLLLSCSLNENQAEDFTRFFKKEESVPKDSIRVVMLQSPTDYFSFLGENLGYNYELASHFSEYIGVPMKLLIADNEQEMFRMLREKEADLIASSIYERNILRKIFTFTAFQDDSHLVLVQLIGLNTITDPDELRGREVHVVDKSAAHLRLKNLNSEFGYEIKIKVLPDTISTNRLIEKVLEEKIELAVADHKTAVLYRSTNRRLDVRLELGFRQRNGWLVRNNCTELLSKIAEWESEKETEQFKIQMYEKYRIRNPYFAARNVRVPKGAISPYDHLFKKYAKQINWDWQMLAAIAYLESRFDTSQVSPRGAAGLMQLMPRTAANFGLSRQNIHNAEMNIEAAVQYIKSLNLMFRRITDMNERIKFILAAYNSGPAHILDAMALAEKYGKNPHVWFENVEYYLAKKNDPDYYNDEVVKYGFFRPNHTIRYVRDALNAFHRFTGGV